MHKIFLSIPRLTPSNNVLLRMHYMKRHQLSKTWLQEVTIAAVESKLGTLPPFVRKEERRTVIVISYRRRRLDPDNYAAGLQPLLNALKKRGLIWDDHEKYIELRCFQRTERDYPRTEVLIICKS